MKKKTFAILLSLVLIVGCVVGGTLAWLTAKTEPVKNTFTTGDIDITLEETTGDEYKMVPGCTITKDPKVSVVAGSEKCYLFVKVEKSENFDKYMTFAMADGWKELTGVTGVFYRVVDASEADQEFAVIKDNTVTVKEDVTKTMMEQLKEDGNYPTLTVTAYASQYMKNNDVAFTPDEAWANASK